MTRSRPHPHNPYLGGIGILSLFAIGTWGIAVALAYAGKSVYGPLHEAIEKGVPVQPWIVILGICVAFASLMLLRRFKAFPTTCALLVALVFFQGLSLFVSADLAFLLAAGGAIMERTRRSFLATNLLLVAAGAFGGNLVGTLYHFDLIIFSLILLSAYDILGVFLFRVIPRLATSAVDRGAPLLLLSPKPTHSWLDAPDKKSVAAGLGGGDLLAPACALAGLVLIGTDAMIIFAFVGAILGLIANMTIVLRTRHPIPALPLITLGIYLGIHLAGL